MVGRAELERRVDALAAEHSGREFADAVRALADTLGDEDTELLQRILVERSVDFDQAVMDRVDARGWFRRQWEKASGTER